MKAVMLRVERGIIIALQLLLVGLVVVATAVVWLLFIRGLQTQLGQIDSIEAFLPVMQKSFAGILIIVLGLELLETLHTYFREHHVRLEVILIVAIIAVGRHIIRWISSMLRASL